MIVYGNGLKDWLQEKIGGQVAQDATFIGRILRENDPSSIVAACAFSNWTGEDVELSFAAEPGSGTVGLLRLIFGYVFGQLGCVRCTATVRTGNHQSLRLCKRIGFKREGLKRKAQQGHDLVILGLLREEYVARWITQTSHSGRPAHDHSSAGTGKPNRPRNAVRQPDVQREPVGHDPSPRDAERV